MVFKAIRTLKPINRNVFGFEFKHGWIFKGQKFKTKELNGMDFIITKHGNLVCRVGSGYQEDYFERIL